MDRVLKKQLKREKSKLLKKRRLSAASITHASKSRKQLEEHRDSPAQMALQAAYEFAGEHEYDLPRAGQALFAYLIHPRTPEEFYKSIHEQTSLLVARKDQPNYYRGLYAHEDLARLPAEAITVSRYVSGERESLAELSAGAFEEGWSIRALRPQAHSDMLWRTCSLLESYWNCNAGANVYWTPAGTQGFAPHYDDVDVFVLQLEGAKRWRVFAPQRDQDTGPVVFPALPRVSSRDFTQSELAQLTLVHDVVLKQGSALYMPRGWVHQAEALPEAASLHVTISMGSQRVTYGDMIERALLAAVKAVRSEGLDSNPGPVDLRRALPRDYASYMGVVHSDQSRDPRRAALEERVTKLIAEHVLPLLPLDAVADDLQAEFLHDRHLPALREGLPPVDESVQVSLDTLVRVTAKGVARMCMEGDKLIVRSCMQNTRVFHETDEHGVVFELDMGEAVEACLGFAEPFTPRQLPLVDGDDEGDDADGERIEGREDGRLLIVEDLLRVGVLRLVE